MQCFVKIRLIIFISFIFLFTFPSIIRACTYEASISGNHLDFNITSDLNSLATILYERQGVSSHLITGFSSPNIGTEWKYYSDPVCAQVNGQGTIVCNQQNGKNAYWSYEQPPGNYHLLPGGIYGLDFSSPPTYDTIKIGFGTFPVNGHKNWIYCTRTGPVTFPKPELTVIKRIINDNGGNAAASDFTITVTGTNVLNPSFPASESGTIVNLDAGSFSVDETGPSGYSKDTEGDCSGTIAQGETKTCTLINDDIAPTITLTKNVTNNIEEVDANSFGMSINGNVVSSGVVNEVIANEPITIDEAGLTNYDFMSIAGDGCPTELGGTTTLSLGQSINCVITNNYVPPPLPTTTPTPVTKIVVIPGLGASWNVDAMINCKKSGYSGEWTIAPYAKMIYEPLLSILPTRDWEAVPFYYDWRRDVRDSSTLLKNLINSNTVGEEKVNLVGHSMGGLVGRAYLESENGGKALKLLTVGTPHKGSALAYPAYVNNEVWSEDLVQKIAATLLFNHCGSPVSLKNLLPTYDYLRDSRTKQLKDVNSMSAKNNYLPTANFIAPFWDVKVGTLAGTGNPTLKTIEVIKAPRWSDGKPIKKEYSNEGDGTVLVDSAQFPGAYSNDVINQSHAGLIASDEGIDKILTFFGSPGINDPPYAEPKSALILVGYPGNFWVTDKDGVTTQSENGMIAIINPTDNNYQLQVVPTSIKTTFIVAQFLSNGQSEYDEYKFKGLTQEPKIIEFNSKRINKNPMHEIREYKRPIFPRFWFNFWKFWNKLRK